MKQFCPVIKTTFPYLSGIVSKLTNKPRSTGCIEEKVLLTSKVVGSAPRFFATCSNWSITDWYFSYPVSSSLGSPAVSSNHWLCPVSHCG